MAWAKGVSGNPRGRRPDAAIAKARVKLARSLPAILDVVIQAALAGDLAAAKLVVERLIPIARLDFEQLEARLNALEALTNDQPN